MALRTVPKESESPAALYWYVTSPLKDANGDPTTNRLTGVQSFDLSSANVTAAVFHFERQDHTTGTWAATIVSQPASSTVGQAYDATDRIVLRHPWAAGGTDIPDVERIRVWPVLTTPSGDYACDADTLTVTER